MIDLRAGCRQPTASGLLTIIVVLLVAPMALTALALSIRLLPLPYPLFLVLQRLPVLFPLHMLTSALAIIAIPIAVFARQHRPFHRAIGRFAALCVLLGGASGLAVALMSEATLVARAGLFAQGLVWLCLLGGGVAAARHRRLVLHAHLMLAMAAVASGAIWLRIVIAGGIAAGLPFEDLYAAATWACWLLPLGLLAMITHRLRINDSGLGLSAFHAVGVPEQEKGARTLGTAVFGGSQHSQG